MNTTDFKARCAALASEARSHASQAASGEDQKLWRQIASDLEKAHSRAGLLEEGAPRGSTPWSGFVASFWAPEVFFSGPWPDSSFTSLPFGWYTNGGTRPALDFCCSRAVDRAPGTSTFWALEVLLFGDYYRVGARRYMIDAACARLIDGAAKVPVALSGGGSGLDSAFLSLVPRFWSPALPEIKVVRPLGCLPGEVLALRPALRPGGGPLWVRAYTYIMLLLCFALPAGAQTLFGVVSKVTDGDTIVIGRARIRLHGIDAPEGRQECREANRRVYHCGNQARAALARLAPPGSSISCRVRDTDRYGRLVAVCSVAQRAGSDLGREMVRAGWAVAYRKYSTVYVADEDAARTASRGLWAGSFQRPEEWRRAH